MSQDNEGDGEIEKLDQDQGAGRAGDDRARDEKLINPAPRRSNCFAPVSRFEMLSILQNSELGRHRLIL